MKPRKPNPYLVKAGALSLLVHIVLLVVLLVSFNWNTSHPVVVAQVELWENLPTEKPAAKPPTPKPVEPEPVKPEPAPEPKPEPKPDPTPEPEPQAEIQVKKKEPEKPKPEPKKPEKKPEPKKPEPKKPDPKPEKKPEPKKDDSKRLEDLKKLQQELLDEASQPAPAQKKGPTQAGANVANQSEIDKYKGLIMAKIKRNVNRQVCGTGKPELELGITLMPTGEVIGSPRLLKSSGIAACDEAVERAVLQSQPLPLPPQPDLFSQFRDLQLKFRPNEDL